MKNKNYISIELIGGVGGDCVTVGNYRVAGPKPYGGGTTKASWNARVSDVITGLMSGDGYVPNLDDKVKRIIAIIEGNENDNTGAR